MVDQDLLDSGKYSIKDVYIPIVGSEFIFGPIDGENCVISHKIYKELLDIEKVEISDIKRLETNFMVQGSWRKLIGIAENLEWKFVEHDTKDVGLVSLYEGISEVKDVVIDKDCKEGVVAKESGEYYRSLLLEFSLKKSGYATMIIREILNTSSSLEIQNKINEKIKGL